MERNKLLREAASEFVEKTKKLPYVMEIALVGSTAGNDPYPNDLDLVIVLDSLNDISSLAKFARQISRLYHSWDVFLFDLKMLHLGRICHRKECPTRSIDCRVPGCGNPKYLQVIPNFKYKSRQFLSSPIEILWKRNEKSVILKKKKSLGIKEVKQYPILKDIELECIKCGKSFIYSAAQQKSFNKRGFVPPKRCPECIDKEYGERVF